VKIFSEKLGRNVGTLLYKFKMQKSLTNALQYHQLKNKSASEHEEGLKKLATNDIYTLPKTAANKMIFEINIKKCFSLRRLDQSFNPNKMQPFFSFDFYTFEYRSPILHGDSPDIDVVQRYEVENTGELQEYFRNCFLKIDFIDDSVDITEPEANDYIGCVRIPLLQMLK
tara:strand:- start:695 stop:1204 length:510 start_codon:yes stop_codon:yes gene_type:complete